ncbi:differentially expressed in FDCP 8 homolog isoform X2 [Zophobas morio]|uniref:differentially expressed in FDCP 8 homolog isoform X2 n=1 Tax=Zophobas morio TaxID=2755281 RepID=UPI0030830359
MCEVGEPSRILASTPSSSTSGCLSNDESAEDHLLPSSLAAEELQLALNKEATEDELLKAISRCKDLVLESNQCSLERKWLVRHLIELRLRLQECREAMVDPQHPRNKSSGVSKRTVRGHHLNLQPLLRSTSSKYCDHCTGTIWSVVQAWYECEDCGYSCHHKCISQIIRECAHVVASERGSYELEICPEEGLSAQKYLCAECRSPLPIIWNLLDKDWSEARRCDYSGLYYCTACHWGSSAVVPARVVHNWDLSPQPVCQASLQQLRVTANRPLLNLEELNPRLFSFVHELSLVRRLRQELHGMRKYLSVCRNATEDHLLWKHVDVPHLVETPELYSLQDLVDTHSGELPSKLHTVIDVFTKHIKVRCEVCRGRGHICEICSNDEVLFPFDAAAVICKDCNAVLHKSCFNRKNNNCPKCIRIERRKEQEQVEDGQTEA